uniref:DUF3782 domain-containing protein n=1 Tax=Candidatus Kentrum sp. FM TaxID=2126340 RepID=A0A450SX59_9GAMM|nr:MAG: hypothetical protein BECKFM1743C_GA0114222_102304 [Candidatus Kentron sp. FM]VFJ59526.1 MAG: hypothetical protein BECKFM1743A_GA0114220_102394 [Candidatus Kentron sp. FM]VFK12113.1 MAG: hypothetical protein BECKFM1743B_GA0114221_102244 [Candidatus Kentron sp. FM]
MSTVQEPTPESVWAFMQETARQMRETDRKMQETDRQLKETDRIIQENAQQMTQQMKETDRRLKKAEDLFTSQWGRLVESLVEGALVPLFQEYGISIQRTSPRTKGCYQGENYEFDILVVNGSELVIVEVKTTLRPRDVRKFIGKLDNAKTWMSEYASKTIYGAMAFLQADAEADKMAENQRLFVIRATGDSASIVNREGFRARTW